MSVHPFQRKEPDDSDEWLTVAEVSTELKISPRTFYRWRELRIGPKSIRLPNGEIRIHRDELSAWLDGLREDAA